MKNIKRMFFVLTLVTLLATVGAVCATEDTNSTTATDSSVNDVAVSDSTSDTIAAEPATISDDNKIDAKTIEKKDKSLKTATKTVEVNSYDELTATIRNALNDSENDEYIINLNEGTYKIGQTQINKGTYTPNIIINANHQNLTGYQSLNKIILSTGCNITINDAYINHQYDNRDNLVIRNSILDVTLPLYTYGYGLDNSGNISFINTTINAKINNANYNNICSLTISDDSVIGSKFEYSGNGQIIINDTSKIAPYLSTYNGNYVLENTTISSAKTNNGNLTIRNATINSKISNYGNLTIEDDVIFGNNFEIDNKGDIFISNPNRLLPYYSSYDGNITIENLTLGGRKNNNGNLTLINTTLNSNMRNFGTLILRNTTVFGSIENIAYVDSYLIIEDDVIFKPTSAISGNTANILINDTSRILPYITEFYGNYTIENFNITKMITNKGNLTIINSSVSNSLTNQGNLTFTNNTILNSSYMSNNANMLIENTTINKIIYNYGNLTIGENVTFEENFTIFIFDYAPGKVFSQNMSSVFPYINIFTGNATIELGEYNKEINNSGNLTIENSTLQNTTTNYANSILTLNNVTVNSTIQNNGLLIISDDTILTDNFVLTGKGEIIINDTQKVADYLTTYTGNISLTNKTIDTNKTNKGNLTLNNCTIKTTIQNDGCILIDDNTTFTPNAKITGDGEIITNNITKLLPYLDTINGNHTITDTTLNKTYKFNGNVTLNNCNITQPNNSNFGTLTLNNCTVDVGEGNIFIDNLGNLTIRKDTQIIGEINNIGGETSYADAPKVYVVNNRTVTYFFNATGLTSIVNEGDILDFQGTISEVTNLNELTINKPINIITTTHDGKIDNFNNITFTKESSGSNITGLYTHNTQFYVINANHMIFNNISNVVENKQVGWGVGQTSIRENSSYITVKNSYFYTKDNGGSSTLVLAWADNCIIENNTIEGNGSIGNMLYITTYNVDIPTNITFNSYNKLINNTIKGPEQTEPTCFGIAYCGIDNLIDGNIITYTGIGITEQWGSGIDGIETNESAFENRNNIISNNKLYGGCGIDSGNTVYNNYIEGRLASPGLAYNNTASSAYITSNTAELTNNTILGNIIIQDKIQSSKIINNTINGNITIPATATNITIIGNNITGTITLNASNNIITDNQITTEQEYTITSRKSPTNNTITNNHLIAKTLTGDKSVNLNKETNTIENNTPYENILKVDTTEFTVGQNATITASIYYGDKINTNITKGKITFKVNGKTLKDENGKVIYAKVVNGTATIENYEVPDTWKEGTIIEAVYSGSTQCEKLTSQKTELNITAQEPTITITPITDDVQTGSTITLKAKIAAGDKAITTGKIVFKINGKTVKDANGKVIYAHVDSNGEVSVDYNLGNLKAGSYTIEATFMAPGYDKITSNTTMTVVKS